MSPLAGFILFVIVALLGWVIAEAKYRSSPFRHSAEECVAQERESALLKKNGYVEKNIRDIIRSSTFRGYKSV